MPRRPQGLERLITDHIRLKPLAVIKQTKVQFPPLWILTIEQQNGAVSRHSRHRHPINIDPVSILQQRTDLGVVARDFSMSDFAKLNEDLAVCNLANSRSLQDRSGGSLRYASRKRVLR